MNFLLLNREISNQAFYLKHKLIRFLATSIDRETNTIFTSYFNFFNEKIFLGDD